MNLNSEVQYLKGVGPRRAAILAGVGIKCLRDLLYYLPRRYIDRSMIVPIGSLKANMTATVIGKVMGSGMLMGRRKRLEVVVGDDSGYISLIWFAGYKYLEKMFKKGDILSVTGQVTFFQQRQIVHPEVERIEDEAAELIHTGRIVPVYPSTAALKKAGITGRALRQLVNRTLDVIGSIPDYLPEKIKNSSGLPPLNESLRLVHYPDKMDDAENSRRRLAFDELLDLQYLILKSRKDKNLVSKSHDYAVSGEKVKSFYKALPFKLTTDQNKAIERIFADMRSERPMHRLLQGDVGCGKTVVALMASVYAAENNLQTAFMVPTELLAEQHYQNWAGPLENIGLNCSLMIGAMSAVERRDVNESVSSGESQIVFGTHAVISESVQFRNLGLVVIDEQHRFGVMQRGKLIGKGQHPDTLVMTATPIPRTLALTLYGDLDITSIKTMPPGRKKTKTVWRNASTRPDVYKYLKTRLAEKEQIFFIYPLVEKSEKLDLQAAEDEYKRLKNEVFTEFKVGLVHGRMKSDQREKNIAAFRNKKLDILVSTTVIEVGIDIPSANIMVIEHAERFGLSQLHQLRGRVGRGGKQGTVVALASAPISDLARKRLDMFVSSGDGFEIAEADLELRGPGEFFGTRQHGLPELTIANLARDTELLTMAREIVIGLLDEGRPLDPDDHILLEYLQSKLAGRKTLTRFG
ncbi:MAG: ATP-dependent DNA helicase RecG [Candidatus Zixiibacteriota bacterium]